MKVKKKQDLSLFKFQIISPVLMEPGRVQAEYFRKMEAKEHLVPDKGTCRIKASTMKGWLYQFKKHGIKGLQSKKRSDSGMRRFSLPQDGFEKILELRGEFLDLSVAQFYRRCLLEDLLGTPPMHETTLRRYLKTQNLHKINEPSKPRKRFEMEKFGDLWVGDYMHGPKVLVPEMKKRKKAILLAFIDDHSRYIVGAQFSFLENTQSIRSVFKQALLCHGVPERIYLDNGPSFSSQYLIKVCADLKIGLVHSKPYDSPSRGKIERFFRTVRSKFLKDVGDDIGLMDLGELNHRFEKWLRKDYLEFYHQGIDATPLSRYLDSVEKYPLQRVEETFLNECFLDETIRKVNKDATISFNKVIYEVPPSYIGASVLIKWPLDQPNEVYLYEGERRIQLLTPVDTRFNGKYRPTPRLSNISLQTNDKGEL
jgi:putative transposase